MTTGPGICPTCRQVLPGAAVPASATRRELAGQPLTAREREIAGYLARGLTYRAIAQKLVLSERTVASHAARIYAKLLIHSRSQLQDLLAARAAG